MKILPIPPFDQAFITALKTRFPERAPLKGESYEDMLWRGGQCAVIRFLEEELERQQTALLEGRADVLE